ncbi:MAG: RrF2 family transcriptional regulator [Bacillota bacterium]|jgi:Rrf2 family iron-sulfur cluster assembly transcriptional regulator
MEIIRRNTDYAIRALVHLAINLGQVVSAGEIAASQEVPIDFLQKILQKFVRQGLVQSHRGIQGGFSLSRDPSQVTVLEIVEIMQGKLVMNRCFLGKDGCPRAPKCALKQNWLDLEQQLVDSLAGITLQDLANQLQGLD